MVSNLNLMESRRRILLNTPRLESLTGSALSFNTDMASKLKECRIHFTPIQEGAGDPSPDNVRPIHGWDGMTVHHNNNSLTIPFPQTIYGGYVDLVNGKVVETYVSRKINTANFGTRLRTNVTDYRGADDYYKSRGLSEFPAPLSNDTYLCDKLYNTGRVTTTGGLTAYMYCNFGSSKYMYVYALASELSEDTLDGLRAYISDLDPQFVYKVNETDYTTYPLDPVTIRTLKGLNNIWSDANGNIEIKYWTH